MRPWRSWEPERPLIDPDPPLGRHRLGELLNPKDVASFDEWGHAVDAPTDTDPGKRLGLPPFTP